MTGTKQIYQQLNQLIQADVSVAVATVVGVSGSVPREVGAKMIIHPGGQHVGTIGGGCGEGEVIKTGLDVIESGTPAMVTVDLTEDVSMKALGVCGGLMTVFVERWAEPTGLLPHLLQLVDDKRLVALATVAIAGEAFAPQLGQRALFDQTARVFGELDFGAQTAAIHADIIAALAKGQSRLLRYADGELGVFVEVQQRPPSLVIVGAGHVAQPLAKLGSLIDFEVTVIDDRPQFANAQRFPTADKIIAAPFTETLRTWPIDSNTHFVLVTRGHSHDVECLLEILDSPARYIGMIGSKRRIRAVFDLLEKEQGIPAEKFERVFAPIGLDIGAETPAEIAVCIIAEIINRYRGGRAVSLSEALRQNRRLAMHPARNIQRG